MESNMLFHVYADDINIALIDLVMSSEDLQRMLDTSYLWGKHWRILIQIYPFSENKIQKKNVEFTVGSNTCRLEFTTTVVIYINW